MKQFYVDQLDAGVSHVLDEDAYSVAATLAQGKTYKQRKTGGDGSIKSAMVASMQGTWDTKFKPFVAVKDDIGIEHGSLSHMLAGTAKTYVTSLLSNIRLHFVKYVERTISELLKRQVARIHGCQEFRLLPRKQRSKWNRRLRQAANDVIYHRHGATMRSDGWVKRWVEQHRHRFVPTLPPKVKTMDVDLTNSKRPYDYLPFMVKMNRCLEALGVKLLSPLPLSTSLIPAFYRIDTASLQHVLMDKKRIDYFKTWHLRHYLRPLHVTSKADLSSSTSKLLGVDEVSAEDEAAFKDAQWRLVGKWDRKDLRSLMPATPRAVQGGRDHAVEEWAFGHSIITDGYSMYLTLTSGDRGRKSFNPRGAGKLRSKQQAQEFPELTPKTRAEFMHLLNDAMYKLVAGDPGKVNNLALADGARRERGNAHSMRYTAAQRRKESGEVAAARKGERIKRTTRVYVPFTTTSGRRLSCPSVLEVETQYLRACNSKSCFPSAFAKYVRRHLAAEQALEAFYRHKNWRSARMTTKMRRRRSELAFVQRIKEKFGEDGKQLVIFYGSWGRHPNLKNQAPSPGIGLRRLIHRYIPTITVAEWYTSSRCASCFGEVQEACASRGLRACGAKNCATQYWDRDVMGALNIRHAAMHILEHGAEHPAFRSDNN